MKYEIPEMTIERARAHVEAGERLLVDAADSYSAGSRLAISQAGLASAHFSAAMAITNVLLTDPAEMADSLER